MILTTIRLPIMIFVENSRGNNEHSSREEINAGCGDKISKTQPTKKLICGTRVNIDYRRTTLTQFQRDYSWLYFNYAGDGYKSKVTELAL